MSHQETTDRMITLIEYLHDHNGQLMNEEGLERIQSSLQELNALFGSLPEEEQYAFCGLMQATGIATIQNLNFKTNAITTVRIASDPFAIPGWIISKEMPNE